MSNKYTSKYPSIIMDKKSNSPNQSLQKKMTIEEYYDLTHHTHKMSDIVMDIEDGDGASYAEMMSTISALSKKIDTLTSTIGSQQKTIDELTETVQTLSNDVANAATVSDWDVETPGNQDAEGNDLGDLMGFQMTEIE